MFDKLSKLKLLTSRFAPKPSTRVPQLIVKNAKGDLLDNVSLVDDKYLLGRGSSCNIKIDSSIISDQHLSIVRDKNQSNAYIIEDLSSNGTYRGKQKIIEKVLLCDGDKFTLGSPQREDRIVIVFRNPLPLVRKIALYGLYCASSTFILATLYVGYEWNKYDVKNIKSIAASNSGVQIYDLELKQTLTKIDLSQKVSDKKLSDFPNWFNHALLISEDKYFYYHPGVDPAGIIRAIKNNVDGGDTQGASTITQQLARTLFSEVNTKNLPGKIKEAIVAFKLESTYSKDEILLSYLNRIFLGRRNGMENSAQLYFDKSIQDINLPEAATLITMLKSPGTRNPCDAGGVDGNSKKKRNVVIKQLAEAGMLKPVDADILRRSPDLPISESACNKYNKEIKAPYFNSYVEAEIKKLLGENIFKEGGITVETGIDLSMQEKAEKAFSQTINSTGNKYNFKLGAIVTLDKDTGLIKAMVGGGNYVNQPRNDAVYAQRQPGSTFKLFAYTAAIESGIPSTKAYSCNSLTWEGQYFSGCNHGSSGNTDLRTGFTRSENAIALRVAKDVGLSKVTDTARKMGIKSKLEEVPRLVLGQSLVNPLEITGAYSTIAAGGIRHQPKAILRIYDTKNCKDREPKNISTCPVLFDATKDKKDIESVLTPAVAATMTSLMRDVVTDGTGKNANIPGLEVVGKTGTTEGEGSKQNTDLWFIGFAKGKSEVTGVWLGNEDNSQMTTGTSAQAAKLWSDYMSSVYR
jgi:membrane peptidoglycan carboxypeptidase